MTFPSSMPMIQRQIEREVAQRTASKLAKALAGVATGTGSPEALAAVTGTSAVLRRMRDSGALSPHAAFVLHLCELVAACAAIVAETSPPGSVSGQRAASASPRRAAIPASLRSSVEGAAAAAGGIPLVPLPSILFCSAGIAACAPAESTTRATLAWLVRACDAGALGAAEVADILACACAALAHLSVWCEVLPVAGAEGGPLSLGDPDAPTLPIHHRRRRPCDRRRRHCGQPPCLGGLCCFPSRRRSR